MTSHTGWVDMTAFPPADPDTVLGPDQTHLVDAALASALPGLPEHTWRAMLDVTWTTLEGPDAAADTEVDDAGHLGDEPDPEHDHTVAVWRPIDDHNVDHGADGEGGFDHDVGHDLGHDADDAGWFSS